MSFITSALDPSRAGLASHNSSQIYLVSFISNLQKRSTLTFTFVLFSFLFFSSPQDPGASCKMSSFCGWMIIPEEQKLMPKAHSYSGWFLYSDTCWTFSHLFFFSQ